MQSESGHPKASPNRGSSAKTRRSVPVVESSGIESPLFNPYGFSPSKSFLASPSPSRGGRISLEQADFLNASDEVSDAFRSQVFSACSLNRLSDRAGSLLCPDPPSQAYNYLMGVPTTADFSKLPQADAFPELTHVRVDQFFSSHSERAARPSNDGVRDSFKLQVFAACSREGPLSPKGMPRSPVRPLFSGATSGNMSSVFVTAAPSPGGAGGPTSPKGGLSAGPISPKAGVSAGPISPTNEMPGVRSVVSETPREMGCVSPRNSLNDTSLSFFSATKKHMSKGYQPEFVGTMGLSISPVRVRPMELPRQDLIVGIIRRQNSDSSGKRPAESTPFVTPPSGMLPEVEVHAVKRSRLEVEITTSDNNTIDQSVVPNEGTVSSPRSEVYSCREEGISSPSRSPSRSPSVAPVCVPSPSAVAACVATPNAAAACATAATPLMTSRCASPCAPLTKVETPCASPRALFTQRVVSPCASPRALFTQKVVSPFASPSATIQVPSTRISPVRSPLGGPRDVAEMSPSRMSPVRSPLGGFMAVADMPSLHTSPVRSPLCGIVKTPAVSPRTVLYPVAEVTTLENTESEQEVATVDVEQEVATVDFEDAQEDATVEDVTPAEFARTPEGPLIVSLPEKAVETALPFYYAEEPTSPKRGCFARFLCP